MKAKKVKKLVKRGIKPYKLNRSLHSLGFKLYDMKKQSSPGTKKRKTKSRTR